MSSYRALSDSPAFDAKEGDVLELELSEQEEVNLLATACFEIVPRSYRVVAEDSIVAGHSTGEEFSHAYSVFEEQALVSGGAIEVVIAEAKAPKSASTKKGKES